MSPSEYRAELEKLAVYAATEVRRLWYRVGFDFDETWYPQLDVASERVAIAQKAAVIQSAAYTPRLLQVTDQTALPIGDIDTQGFAGTNRYGNPLPQVLAGATTKAKTAVAGGADVGVALFQAGLWLRMTARTLVYDAGRSVVAADIAQRPSLGGYVRVLNPPSCARCIPLAGKWFRWNEGFQRHPKCDCVHRPAREEAWAKAEGFITDPYDAFNSLSRKEQDRLFGSNDAEAIRNGADMYRVTNIRTRGLPQLSGRRGWQARRYGTPSRMTVDDIFATAGNDRQAAVRMLLDEGYITGPQTVGGNIKGRYFEGYAGTMGRGGTRRGATMAYQQAQRTGIRDPYAPTSVSLDSATQTAAERRLHRAFLNQRAVNEGRNPYGSSRLSESDRQTARMEYERQIELLPDQPPQVRRLAALLGMV